MKNTLSALIFLSLLAGCASKNELKGVQEIVNFYGGSVNYSKGAKTSTVKGENTGAYFQIELDSTNIKKYFETADLPAANCAYLFYHSLSEKEKNNYSFIRVIIPEYSRTEKYEFRTETLQKVEQCMPVLDRVVACLKDRQYKMLPPLFNPIIPADSLSEEKIREPQQSIDSTYGRIRSFALQGFYFQDANIGGQSVSLLRLTGNLVREKQNTNFSITVDPDLKERNLYGYRFMK
jgi:hypothetical protein